MGPFERYSKILQSCSHSSHVYGDCAQRGTYNDFPHLRRRFVDTVQGKSTACANLFLQGSVHTSSDLDCRSDSSGTFRQMRAWLSQCEGSAHSRCPGAQKPPCLPKRLIRVGDASTDRIYVVDASSVAKDVDKYVTLSHCWGNPDTSPPILKLTLGDHKTFTNPAEGIPWSKLPRNFQESIQIARELKVRYIWIDALCIVQDNGEFQQEGQFMHEVYRYSFCNLAAASSKDGSGGLFRDRSTEQLNPTSFETSGLSAFGQMSWTIHATDTWDAQVLDQPLYKRGWVFQGKLSSNIPESTDPY